MQKMKSNIYGCFGLMTTDFNFTDLSFFENALELYHSKHKEVLAIPQKRHLGLLLVDKTKLKEKLVSSPLCCLEVRISMCAHRCCTRRHILLKLEIILGVLILTNK